MKATFTILILLISSLISAQNGTLVSDFGTNGVLHFSSMNNVEAMARLDEDRILILGTQQITPKLQVFNNDGEIDEDFGTNGVLTPEIFTGWIFAFDVDITPEGEIVCALLGDNTPHIFKYNSSGQSVTSFGNNGVVILDYPSIQFWHISKIIAAENGSLFILGVMDFTPGLIKLLADGTPDPEFNNGEPYLFTSEAEYGIVTDLHILPDNSLLMAAFTTEMSFIQKLNSAGTPVSEFGSSSIYITGESLEGMSTIYGMHVSDASIHVTGEIFVEPNISSIYVEKLDLNGQQDNNFGESGIALIQYTQTDSPLDILVQEDQSILIAATAYYGIVSKLTSNGELDLDFGVNGTFTLNNLGGPGMLIELIEDVEENTLYVIGDGLDEFGLGIAYALKLYNDQGVGLSEDHELSVNVYPNPFSSTISIQIPKELYNTPFSICNLLGETIQIGKTDGSNSYELFIGNENPSGIYFLRFNDKSGGTTLKLLKQ